MGFFCPKADMVSTVLTNYISIQISENIKKNFWTHAKLDLTGLCF